MHSARVVGLGALYDPRPARLHDRKMRFLRRVLYADVFAAKEDVPERFTFDAPVVVAFIPNSNGGKKDSNFDGDNARPVRFLGISLLGRSAKRHL